MSHIRSILEYCSPIWSPANLKDILLLERVQRRATKYILNNYSDFSYAERCIKLSILPLCFRREINDLLLFFKYSNSYVDCNFSSYFELVFYVFYVLLYIMLYIIVVILNIFCS